MDPFWDLLKLIKKTKKLLMVHQGYTPWRGLENDQACRQHAPNSSISDQEYVCLQDPYVLGWLIPGTAQAYSCFLWKLMVVGSRRVNIIWKLLWNDSGILLDLLELDLEHVFNQKVDILIIYDPKNRVFDQKHTLGEIVMSKNMEMYKFSEKKCPCGSNHRPKIA